MENKKINFMMYLIGFIVISLGLYFITPHGLGVSPDSVAYMKGAQGFLIGEGYKYVSAEWPPLYPTLLIIFGKLLNNEVMVGARALQSFLYGVNFLLLGLIFNKYLKLTVFISCLLSGLILIQPLMVYIHFYAWSEPCLIALLLADIYLIYFIVDNKNNSNNNIAILTLILISSCALLTRFAGITLVLLNSLIIFIYIKNKSIYLKSFQSFLQFIIPVLCFIPWLSHRGISNGPATDRAIEFHPITLASIEYGLTTIGKWIIPNSGIRDNTELKSIYIIIGLLLIIFLIKNVIAGINLLFFSKSNNKDKHLNSFENLQFICSLYPIIYLSFLIMALSFVDNKVSLDDRILSPAFICIIILIISTILKLKNRFTKKTVFIFLLLIMFSAYPNLRSWLLISYFNGIEMSDKNRQNKNINKFISSCLITTKVYADNPWNFDLVFESKVLWLPRKILFNTGKVNNNYINDIQKLITNAELIIIENANADADLIIHIENLNSFVKIYADTDGLVYANTALDTVRCDLDNRLIHPKKE